MGQGQGLSGQSSGQGSVRVWDEYLYEHDGPRGDDHVELAEAEEQKFKLERLPPVLDESRETQDDQHDDKDIVKGGKLLLFEQHRELGLASLEHFALWCTAQWLAHGRPV